MKISGQRILLTGAAGGIGSELAVTLAKKGAELILVDIDMGKLEGLKQRLQMSGGKAHVLHCDLSAPDVAQGLADRVMALVGGVDTLINCAGIAHFGLFENQSSEHLEKLWQINVITPMQLTQAVLPKMTARHYGAVVNVGSVFGSIGFAYFTTYSASKFAIRGFSESLRRELEGSGVQVIYVGPRYTKTPLNDGVVSRMAQAVGMNSDEPALVAAHIVRAIEKDSKDYFIGWPECLFVRLNAIFPRLVDGALRKQNQIMRTFATSDK